MRLLLATLLLLLADLSTAVALHVRTVSKPQGPPACTATEVSSAKVAASGKAHKIGFDKVESDKRTLALAIWKNQRENRKSTGQATNSAMIMELPYPDEHEKRAKLHTKIGISVKLNGELHHYILHDRAGMCELTLPKARRPDDITVYY